MRFPGRFILAGGLALALVGLVPQLARAEHTRHWRQSAYEEFEKGTAKGVALRSDEIGRAHV